MQILIINVNIVVVANTRDKENDKTIYENKLNNL
jgi:hypothetical protein